MDTWVQIRRKRIRLKIESDTQPYPGDDWWNLTERGLTGEVGQVWDGTAFVDPQSKVNPKQKAIALIKQIDRQQLKQTDAGKALLALLWLAYGETLEDDIS